MRKTNWMQLFLLLIFLLPVFATAIEVTIGSGNTLARMPVDMYYKNSLFETIYYPSEINATGSITQIKFYNSFVTTLTKTTRIWLGTTTQADLASGWIASGLLTQVFNGNVSYPSGSNTITINLTTPFMYTGGNLVMMVQRPMDSSYYNSADTFYCQTVGTNRTRNIYSDSSTFYPTSPPTSGYSIDGTFPKTTFVLTSPANPSTPVNNAVNIPVNTLLTWTRTSTYTGTKLFFGTDNPPTNIVNGTDLGASLSYTPTANLLYNTMYYWRVVGYNAGGDGESSSVVNFTTEDNPVPITVISPNGGEVWKYNTTKTVYWNSNTSVSTVNVYLSTNNGTSWISLTPTPVAASAGSYSFTVPAVPTTQARVKVENSALTTVYDISDNVFTINNTTPPAVTLTAPDNSGLKLQAGRTYNLTWTYTSVSNVKIEYSINNGSTWNTIAASVPASDGSYPWSVPDEPSPNCRIRLSDVANPLTYDQSNYLFTICKLELTNLNAGDLLQAGSTKNITWTSSQISNVMLEYSSDGGANWNVIAASIAASLTTYSWTVPSAASDQYSLRISDAAYSSIFDTPAGNFLIGTITITYPSATGIKLQSGRTYNITWSNEFVSPNVKLEYSTNGGTVYTQIATDLDCAGGSYAWLVPDVQSNNCRIRISLVGNPQFLDVSNNSFTQSYLTLNSPVGGETWGIGSTHSITWSKAQIDNVDLKYSTDNGLNWTDIVTNYGAEYLSYAWTIPNNSSTQCLVKIVDHASTNVFAESSAPFTIRSQVIVTAPNGGENLVAGSITSVTWTHTDELQFVLLDYSVDAGANWLTIQASPYSAIADLYDWIVPFNLSTSCLVRVRSSADVNVYDVSNAVFTITEEILPPEAEFSADIRLGLEPLTVQFTDLTLPGAGVLTAWSWNFGDETTSTEQHPLHVYTTAGFYTVSLTVTNVYDLTDTETKYGYITVNPRQPYASLVTSQTLNFGSVYVAETAPWQNVQITNTGTADLHLSSLEFMNTTSDFELQYSNLATPVVPGASYSFQVRFAPLQTGSLFDTLYIHSDAVDNPVLKVKLTGTGEFLPPVEPDNLTISTIGNDVHLSWDAVEVDIHNNPIIPDGYIVLYNETPYTDTQYYYFLDFVETTSAVHQRVARFRQQMYYKVVAFKDYSREGNRTVINTLHSENHPITYRELLDRLQ